MRSVLICLAMLAGTTAFAQTDKTTDRAQVEIRLKQELENLRIQHALTSCPVGITAQHQGSPAAIWTASLEDSHRSPTELAKLHTGIHVNLAARNKALKSVELAVFYLPSGPRVLPVTGSPSAASSGAPKEASKNFSLITGSSSHQLDGDLLLGPVASITRVTLMHVTYADGSEWNPPAAGACSVQPSPFMLVTSR